MADIQCTFSFVYIKTEFPTLFHHTIAIKHHIEENKIERLMIIDSESDCCSEDEGNGWSYETEDDKELVQATLSSLPSSPSSWRPTQQLGRRGPKKFSGGSARIILNTLHAHGFMKGLPCREGHSLVLCKNDFIS
jgi:hypothetical protein